MMTATATTTVDLLTAVTTYRAHGRAYRGIMVRWVTGQTGGRNLDATNKARLRHVEAMEAVIGDLIAAGLDPLGQALTAESQLLMRIAESRRNGIDRPELQDRLNSERRFITDVVGH